MKCGSNFYLIKVIKQYKNLKIPFVTVLTNKHCNFLVDIHQILSFTNKNVFFFKLIKKKSMKFLIIDEFTRV